MLLHILISSLGQDEIARLCRQWIFGYEAFACIDHFCNILEKQLTGAAKELYEVALADLDSVPVLLGEKQPTLKGAAIHCQQATEKFLKSFLSNNGFALGTLKKCYSHDLPKILSACLQVDVRLASLSKPSTG